MADVPVCVISDNTSSERRVTPSWTISQLRSKLETITGIPPSSQLLSLQTSKGTERVPIDAADEDSTRISSFPLAPYAELHVGDSRPAAARPNYNDTSAVDKYVMPEDEYERKTDSVLAWKKQQKLGRFDPDAPHHERAKLDAMRQEVCRRGIDVGKRCRVGGEDARRGVVEYVGDVDEIPSGKGTWVGIRLDEPVGKNDGSIAGRRYWGEPSEMKHGVFVRPDRVEVGDYPPMDDLEDMEEI
ncbi:tubulin specific chaperone cofactor B [Drechmeria coniospora]|uniref:Tubulin specific chaperone cofactor B n=1 Tax=Drechmeria coniospora TaxID=98403 RepID=A0A151GF24_DRECN|nr:tubulin specific chaperone cofactor B [Drechmeria coniospora]KYK55700.1 tubulin specific chaperone cofactor B [Drechmeria coniospora]